VAEDYSATGPSQLKFNTNGDPVDAPQCFGLSNKPEVAGCDGEGLEISPFGSFGGPFVGTSAAAASAAAVAAILLQADPSLQPHHISQLLRSTAGGNGQFDPVLGFGVVNVTAAVNAVGSAIASVAVGPPDVPLDVKVVVNSTGGTALLSWRTGCDGGSVIESYIIDLALRSNGSERLTVETRSDRSSFSLNGTYLTPGLLYAASVAALNAVNSSDASNSVTVVLPAVPTSVPSQGPPSPSLSPAISQAVTVPSPTAFGTASLVVPTEPPPVGPSPSPSPSSPQNDILLPSPPPATSSGSSINVGAIVGGVVGAVAGVALIAVFIVLILRSRRGTSGQGLGHRNRQDSITIVV